MARTSTRKPRTQERANNAGSNGGQVAESAAPESNGATDPIGQLRAAYQAATDARDETTGAIPDEHLQAVKVAYLAVRKRDRGEIAAALNAETADKMIRDDDTVDTGLAHAMGTLAALFKALYGERGGVPHDPVPGIAGMIAALRGAPDRVLDMLGDDQRERVANIEVTVDEQAQAAFSATMAAVEKLATRTVNGRRRSAGSGGPARDLAEIIRKALADAEGETVVLNYIARTYDVSTGALGNRWAKDNIEGVNAVHDTNGKKAFQAA